MTELSNLPEDYKIGKVLRVIKKDGKHFGFISCDDLPDQQIFYKALSFNGNPPLSEGETVIFQLREYEGKFAAHNISRQHPKKLDINLTENRLLNWAYLGYVPKILEKLKGSALKEKWEFKNTPPDPDRPMPILRSYLMHTFSRLILEKKVLVSNNKNMAAFNTGLVDRLYEPIYAIFGRNNDPRALWAFTDFCIAGEGPHGQNLVRNFAQLPSAAHYFDDPIDLIYDIRSNKPVPNRHIVIERIERYPAEFVEDFLPTGFQRKDVSQLSHEDKKIYYQDIGVTIEKDTRKYRQIMKCVEDAIDLSIKRVAWNFRTAIPAYYTTTRQLQLLLPLCLISDEKVDLALAVEKTDSGSYLGHTVLPLDWAYNNSRLVCRPDSDWLAPDEISAASDDEEG